MTHKSAPKTNRSDTASQAGFTFSNSASYAEKDEYVEKQLIFSISSIVLEPTGGYEGRPRWVLTVSPREGRSEELLTLATNAKRDIEMQAAQTYIERAGTIENATLRRIGRAYYLASAVPSTK